MHLVEILLPLYDNDCRPFSRAELESVRKELTDRFGGVTAHVRSPAEGFWKEDGARTVRDDIVIYEVMVEALDEVWWRAYREELAKRFRQDTLIVRASPIRML